jgi:hypothetical protein
MHEKKLLAWLSNCKNVCQFLIVFLLLEFEEIEKGGIFKTTCDRLVPYAHII